MSISKLANGTFQARWRDPDGKQRTKCFPTRREAADHEAQVRIDMRRGAYTGHKPGVTVRQYAEESFLPRLRDLRATSVQRYTYAISKHVVPKLGSRKLGSLTVVDVERFIGAISRTLAPSSVGTVHAVLHALLRDATKEGLIAANPATGARLPRVQKRVLEPLSPAAVAALAAAIHPRYEVAVWLAAGCGLREGEVLGMKVSRIDFLRRKIHVLEQMQDRRLVELKTKASRRVVPADDFILQKISAHIAAFPGGYPDLLISNKDGRPVQRNAFGTIWRKAVKAAGLPEGTRFHDLRHAHASMLVAAGVHMKVLQERLGHATMAETADTYSHLYAEAQDVGRGAIEAAFAQASEGAAMVN